MKILAALLLATSACAALALDDEPIPFAPRAAVPPNYPASYEAIVRAAEAEGRLVIYATTDEAVAAPLLRDFRAMYPRIEVEYDDQNSTELHHRFIAEFQRGAATADVLWSTAMDQQASLVSNGYALGYESPEGAALPAWAQWKNQAWSTTLEPIAIVYNKTLLPAADVPRTHADLARLLGADLARLKGKVATYDIEKSGVGFFLATQDAAQASAFWDIAAALGKADARQALTTDAMLRRVASGQALIAYNVLGSYAQAQAREQPALGVLYPTDYTLVMSRVVFINRQAAHPNAAKLWLDHLLSKRGQTLLASRSRLYAVRDDVTGEFTAAALARQLGASMRPIRLGPALIGYLNNENYREFVLQWRKSTALP